MRSSRGQRTGAAGNNLSRVGDPPGARLAAWTVPDSWRVISVLIYAIVVPTQAWALVRYASSPASDDLVTFAVVSVIAWGWCLLMVSHRVEAWQGGVLVRNACTALDPLGPHPEHRGRRRARDRPAPPRGRPLLGDRTREGQPSAW